MPADLSEEEGGGESSQAQEDEATAQEADERDVLRAPDRKVRHSVINHDPDALRRVVREDPEVAEAVRIFEGKVIDMHVM